METRFSVILPSKAIGENEADVADFSKKSFIKDWIPLPANIIKESWDISTNNSLKKHTLLIVENEVDVQTFLKSALSQKYNITIANNGLEALEKIEQQEPDLVVSDVMMPEMDGYAFLEALKGSDDYRGIPVIMLTALDVEVNKLQALTLGVDDYLTKPFSPKELLARAANLLHRYEERKSFREEEGERFTEGTSFVKDSTSIAIETATQAATVSKADTEWINAVAERLQKELENDAFHLSDLVDSLYMSAQHFRRKVKKITGLSPKQFQQEIALQKARKLLENNAYANTTAIAYSVGIYNVTRFSTLYESRFGKRPGEYFG